MSVAGAAPVGTTSWEGLGRAGEAGELTAALIFLASDGGSYVNGQTWWSTAG